MIKYHIYKKDGFWHVLDYKAGITYNFNYVNEALYATKMLDSLKNFNVGFRRRRGF